MRIAMIVLSVSILSCSTPKSTSLVETPAETAAPTPSQGPLIALQGVEVDRATYDRVACLEMIQAGVTIGFRFKSINTTTSHRQRELADLMIVDYAKVVDAGLDTSKKVSVQTRVKKYSQATEKTMRSLKKYAPKLADQCLSDVKAVLDDCMSQSGRESQMACANAGMKDVNSRTLKAAQAEFRTGE